MLVKTKAGNNKLRDVRICKEVLLWTLLIIIQVGEPTAVVTLKLLEAYLRRRGQTLKNLYFKIFRSCNYKEFEKKKSLFGLEDPLYLRLEWIKQLWFTMEECSKVSFLSLMNSFLLESVELLRRENLKNKVWFSLSGS